MADRPGAGRVRRAFENLVGNTMKYGERAQVRLPLAATATSSFAA